MEQTKCTPLVNPALAELNQQVFLDFVGRQFGYEQVVSQVIIYIDYPYWYLVSQRNGKLMISLSAKTAIQNGLPQLHLGL